MDYEYYDDYVYYDYDVVPSTPKRIDRPRRRQYGGIKNYYYLKKMFLLMARDALKRLTVYN